jgi:hypothetical protein
MSSHRLEAILWSIVAVFVVVLSVREVIGR